MKKKAQTGYTIPPNTWLDLNNLWNQYGNTQYLGQNQQTIPLQQMMSNQPMGGTLDNTTVYGQSQPQMQWQPSQLQYQPYTPYQAQEIPQENFPQIDYTQINQNEEPVSADTSKKGGGFKNPFESVGLNVGGFITGLTNLAASLVNDDRTRKPSKVEPYNYSAFSYGNGSNALFANGGTLYEKGTDKKYENWFKRNTREGQDNINPWDNNLDYNYYQYYQDMNQGITPFVDPNSEDHYPDTYKLPNHPSFSIESMYYTNPQDQPNVLSYTGEFKNGGSINIPKENRGLFTQKSNDHNMSVQEFARYVLSHKEDFPLKTERQAQFSQNSTKWNKAEDGKTVSKNKAKEILRDGTANKKPLTDKQKRYFGWIAGGKKEDGGMLPNYTVGQELDLPQEQIDYLLSLGYEFE